MKLSIAIVSLCIVASAYATFAPTRPGQPSFPYPGTRGVWPPRSTGPTFPRPPQNPFNHRFRREARPQHNSISLEGVKPLSGPNRQPSLDLNFNRRIFENDRGNVDAYGGANWSPGRLSPHAGLKFERNYGNGFLGGHGQVQPGPRGGLSPSFGIHGGWRF